MAEDARSNHMAGSNPPPPSMRDLVRQMLICLMALFFISMVARLGNMCVAHCPPLDRLETPLVRHCPGRARMGRKFEVWADILLVKNTQGHA